MKAKTKEQLREDIALRDETIEAMHRQIMELQRQIQAGAEQSPIYKQAIQDIEDARADAEAWKKLYEQQADVNNHIRSELGDVVLYSVYSELEEKYRKLEREMMDWRDAANHYKDLWIELQNGLPDPPKEKAQRGRPVEITEDIREKIICERVKGETIRVIAEKFGVGVGSVARITEGINVPRYRKKAVDKTNKKVRP